MARMTRRYTSEVRAMADLLAADPAFLSRVESMANPPAPGQVRGAADAAALLQPRMVGLLREELWGIYLNRRHAVLSIERLSVGNGAQAIVCPREVFRPAVRRGAAAVIVAHNHPSGDPTPSLEDCRVTTRLLEAGEVLGISLLDHLVMAGEKWVSMSEAGRILQHGRYPSVPLSQG